MKSGSFAGVLLIVFAVWVVMAANNAERIDRVCRPVTWLGNISVSLTSLVSDGNADAVQGTFNRLNYGCRFTVWRLFFEKSYLKAMKDGKAKPGAQSQGGAQGGAQ